MKESGANVNAQNRAGQLPHAARLGNNRIVDGLVEAARLAPRHEIQLPQPRGTHRPHATPLRPLSLPSSTLNTQHLGYQLRHFATVMEFVTQRTAYALDNGTFVESLLPHSVVLPLIMRQAEEAQAHPMAHCALQAGGWSSLAHRGGEAPLLAFYRKVLETEQKEDVKEDAEQLCGLLHHAYVSGVVSLLNRLKNSTLWRQYDKEEKTYRLQVLDQAGIDAVVKCLENWHQPALGDEDNPLPEFGTYDYRQVLRDNVATSALLAAYHDTVIAPIMESAFAPVQQVLDDCAKMEVEQNRYFVEQLRQRSIDAYDGKSDNALRTEWRHQPCRNVRKPQQRAYEAFCYDELLALSQGLLDEIYQASWLGLPQLARIQRLVQQVSTALPDNYWVINLLPTDLLAFAELALCVVRRENERGVYEDEIVESEVMGVNGLAHAIQSMQGLRTGVYITDDAQFLSLLSVGRLPLHHRDIHNRHLLDYCVAHRQPDLLRALYRHYGQPSPEAAHPRFLSSSLALVTQTAQRNSLSQQLSTAKDTTAHSALFDAIQKALKTHKRKLLRRENELLQQSYDYLTVRLAQRKPLEQLVATSQELALRRTGKKRYYIEVNRQFEYQWRYFLRHSLEDIQRVVNTAFNEITQRSESSGFAASLSTITQLVKKLITEAQGSLTTLNFGSHLAPLNASAIEPMLTKFQKSNAGFALTVKDFQAHCQQNVRQADKKFQGEQESLVDENAFLKGEVQKKEGELAEQWHSVKHKQLSLHCYCAIF